MRTKVHKAGRNRSWRALKEIKLIDGCLPRIGPAQRDRKMRWLARNDAATYHSRSS
jgi:hypothetical protein